MDISRYLKNVKSFEDYAAITRDFQNKFALSKIRLNMSSVLALRNIKLLEIEYFTKKYENGAAVLIFSSLLNLPASKTWGLLGKELILLMKYWFDTLRQELVQGKSWWNFLLTLLKFVQEIRIKDGSINNTIVEELSETLLDWTIHPELNIKQRHRVIQCFNICSSESSREIRYALRHKLEAYFKKLSALLPYAGDFRLQYSMLEALMRWLLPRQDMSVRKKAAEIWFATEYSQCAVDIFLQRSWMNFFKDARDFLNAQNSKNNLITSVHCRKINIGKIEFINETDKKYWVDFNISSKCITLMLELKLLITLRTETSFADSLIITTDNTSSVKMMTDALFIKIIIILIDPKQMYNSEVIDGNAVEMYFSPANARKIDDSLKKIFGGKYQVFVDLEKICPSTSEDTCESSQIENSEDHTRFSLHNTVAVRRRKHSGVITRPRKPISRQSPTSTASTSSLALLREKLSALPGCRFDREPVSVCALPQLSNVTEVTETDNQSLNETFKLRPFGVALKSKSDSDRPNLTTNTVSETSNLSPPNIHDENSISCLLVATIGSADDSIINDTLDRLPKDKEIHTDNIVDLLVQEALHSKGTKKVGENIQKALENRNNGNVEVIENTPVLKDKVGTKKEATKPKDWQTSDESNTEYVDATPCYITSRQEKVVKRKNAIRHKGNEEFEQTLVGAHKVTDEVVDAYFSQHFTEVDRADAIISPTLAKKINETSSESSEDFDLPVQNEFHPEEFNFNELDILDCLNDLVDQVCEELKNYSRLVDNERHLQKTNTDMVEAGLHESIVNKNTAKACKNQAKKKGKKAATKQIPLKIKFKSTSPVKRDKKHNKSKLQVEEVSKMSTIYEADSILEKSKADDKNSSPDQALVRRKRKLYSPNDDNAMDNAKGVNVSETDDDTALSELKQLPRTPKWKATPYKELEQIKKSARRIRNRKSRTEPCFSPRSKRNDDLFNSLKKTIENNDDIKLVDTKKGKGKKDSTVYNFSSDSEDDDFKGKNIKISTNDAKPPSTRNRRNKPKVNYSDKKAKAKNATNVKSKKKIEVLKMDLTDEKIRDRVSENLDASLVIEPPKEPCENVEPGIIQPVMEVIEEQISQGISASGPEKKAKQSKRDQTIKKGNELEVALNTEKKREESFSPLPGLIVETLPEDNDRDDSIFALDKLKDAYERGSSIGKHLELNTTQNLLSDGEQLNYSPPHFDSILEENDTRDDNYKIRINAGSKVPTTEGSQISESSKSKNTNKKNKNPRKNTTTRKAKKLVKKTAKSSTGIGSVKCEFEIIEVTAVIENQSAESIPTVGRSPITGHGDLEEQPPNVEQLSQKLKPRDVEIEYLDQSIKDYHKTLAEETRQLWNTKCPSIKNLSEEEVKSIVNNSPSVSITRLSLKDLNQCIPPRYNSVFGSHSSTNSSTQTRSQKQKDKSTASFVKKVETERIQSSISPIKLLDFKPKSQVGSVSDDSYVYKIKKIFSKKSVTTDQNQRYEFRKRTIDDKMPVTSKRQKLNSTIRTSSPIESVLRSNRRYASRSGDKSTVKSVTLKNDSESVAMSSVSNWLRKSQESLKKMPTESFDEFMYKDNLKLIMEKVDTSLMEIHHHTSQKYSNLFVDMQKQLKEGTENRYELYRSTGNDILANIVHIIDQKFMELDQRCKEMDEQIRQDFKEKSRQLLHEDSKKKQQFLGLLKQDILRTLPK